MLLSIVITTFNRADSLSNVLEHLQSQTDRNFEVVVAIDGSTDGTEEMLRGLQAPFPLKWVNTHYSGYGLAIARNMGIIASSGELVAIIDDDCLPTENFVAAHKSSAERRAIVGGPRDPADASDERQVEKMRELASLPYLKSIDFETLHRTWPRAVTTECNICMFRDDLLDMGLFSERLRIYGFIGQEFFARAKHLGYKYKYNPDASIVHARQSIGDNGLTFNRKRFEIMLARAMNPSLMNEKQYRVQMDWARKRAGASDVPLPPIPPTAYLVFPFRFLRNRAGDVRRLLRDRPWARAGQAKGAT